MSVGLEAIRERMAGYLTGKGVVADAAWPGEDRMCRDEPVVAVSLKSCQVGPAGFQDYLGERYNEETGLWEELYGRRAKLIFGLNLYAPAGGDGARLQTAFDILAAALAQGGPEGLAVEEFSCGETVFDGKARLLMRPAQAVCAAYLYAVAQPGGIFTDFELRGGMNV